MEDIIIAFETAKLAKNKGFNSIEGWSRMYNQDGEFISPYKETYPAPTQSLLQKWLREKHKLYILINYVGNEQFNWEINMFQHGEYGIGFKGTYEEALEEGLKQALKLIK